ncbi:hypothetical protein V6N11_059383 [Hibiscus sabdariffa]|uniref:F-box protein n=1 Tax=Hibiscus sabdariffa TaxID=183260 RepID=A0ABR2AE74_9ROSI
MLKLAGKALPIGLEQRPAKELIDDPTQDADKETASPNIYHHLLYSPFTGELIELPALDLGCRVQGNVLSATFYLSSKSPECLVFNVHTLKDTISINTYRPGDKNWKTYNFVQSVFDIRREEWKLLVRSWRGSDSRWRRDDLYLYGELVAIPRSPCMPYKRERVMKFDFSASRWVKQLNFKEMEHPDLRFLSSSEPLGESSSDHHLYAYLYSRRFNFLGPWRGQSRIVLIEPPLKCIWRRQHLLDHS